MKKIYVIETIILVFILLGCSSGNDSETPSTNTVIPELQTSTSISASTTTQTVSEIPSSTILPTLTQGTFSFVSMGNSQVEVANFITMINQVATLHPNLIIFNGDLEINGVMNSEIKPLVTAINQASLIDQTFFVRSNIANGLSGNAPLWQAYFEISSNFKMPPSGVTDYVSLDSISGYLNYSFIYENSIFIGLDVPGNADLLTSKQLNFLDSRLTYAESKGLVHGFIFFHGPLYCVEGTHCDCTTRPDVRCTPSELTSILNKHPIVSATFHGHEHILGWTHMDKTIATGLAANPEDLITSTSGGATYNPYLSPARLDYTYMDVGSSQGFAAIAVDGWSFSVNYYKVGKTSPVWTKTFTKGIPQPANTSEIGARPLKYYLADRVLNTADFAKLAAWGINTAMVDFDVNGKPSRWQSIFVESAKYGINIVIWPSDWRDRRPDCDWAAPFPVSANGDITKVKPLLDVASQYPNFIGIINGHEYLWTCKNMTFDEMAGLKDQLKAYALSKGRDIKIWNYTDSIYDESMLPASQIPRIMDVAVIWKHCAGNTGRRCTGNNSTLARIQNSRTRLTDLGLGGKVELVFVIQTFTSGSPYNGKYSLSQLEATSCEFLHTTALDGFGFYTWDAGWWSDLHGWPDLQPAIRNIHDNCIHADP